MIDFPAFLENQRINFDPKHEKQLDSQIVKQIVLIKDKFGGLTTDKTIPQLLTKTQ